MWRLRSLTTLLLLAADCGGTSAFADAAGADSPAAIDVSQSAAPDGLLTRLETRRHEAFVAAARRGDIDVVFIGDSDTDFWRDDGRGKAEWDRDYAPLKAVNFGVQGAHTKSVLWRLRNGELDGFQAKVVVLSALGVADRVNHGADVATIVAGDADIVAEIRKRQPQARILLLGMIPRGETSGDPLRQFTTTVNTELARLGDNRSIYFLDMSERFLAPDGTLSPGMRNAGLSSAGYSTWADAMNPKLRTLLP